MEDDHKPVTKAELKDALEALKDELIEAFRDSETKLLQGFCGYA